MDALVRYYMDTYVVINGHVFVGTYTGTQLHWYVITFITGYASC